ncbi:uncharacterized protein PGTG_12080 [Puccinia graminis f. sp. tritici CRL 75-36-700-3]|uniref:Uncharacterized protein n=1 Tax=Puccinia graminis f. sp. tritici (strain CRL 75-36-700-3 / race SCCL) TaxID=418459 RepID=E3KP99_PUCGT|nr:uncharacterized protein PGTG_12080 [Puccinia graminis f. sp. tritici CRL 75-36-700-3]EFP86124.1 hypothetical protein PGTG_12080 [Puccinia graminis f. sp. tritici CRL 75-36-700-3]
MSSARPFQRRRDPPWDLDGINHGPSSNAILLQWISTEDNYRRWDRTTFDPTERLNICEEIVRHMQMQGIAHRHARGINTRIQILRRSYNTAREFVNHARGNTNEIAPVILGYARRVCPYWDILDPVMGGQHLQSHQAYTMADSETSSDTDSTNTT